MLIEDLTKTPFERTKKNYKKFRKCYDKDYEKTG